MWYWLIVGYISTIGLLLAASLCRKDEQKRRQDFLTAIVLSATGTASGPLMDLFVRLLPHTMDNSLLTLDRCLGFDTIYWIRAAAEHRFLMFVCLLAYLALSSMIVIAWIVEQNRILRRAIVIGWLGCWFFYAAFPAVGPGIYDWASQSSLAWRNCVPSMHLTWALLLAINARLRWWRVCLWLYAGLIAISTITTGQHYLVDLVAAVPYTFAVQWMASHLPVWRGSLVLAPDPAGAQL